MKLHIRSITVCLYFLLAAPAVFAQDETAVPVSPHASPEAKALLQLICNLSGKYTLTGQHNYPSAGDRNSVFAADYVGQTPVIWSMDFGFAKAGDQDSYLMRSANVKEAIRQNKKGSIITFCWHAVPPTVNEPITFQPLPDADPSLLASVEGRLTDQQFQDILTPGTGLNKHWMAQVDTIAYYLKQLQKAHVAVLWRPYHEMNGNWFWWGNHTGQYSTQALYRQMFDRLVNYHKLNNLVWVWSVDRPTKPGMEFTNFYPGDKYVDILALDVYGSDFKQDYYNQLLALSKGKPITLAEVGSPPSPEILAQQPKWSYWVIWAGMVGNTPWNQYQALLNDPRMLWQEDAAYINAVNPFRQLLGLPLLKQEKADFSGTWVLDEDKSILNGQGAGGFPYKLGISEKDNELSLQSAYLREWTTDRVTDETLKFTGEENTIDASGGTQTLALLPSPDRDTLIIKSISKITRGSQVTEIKSMDLYTLQQHGKILEVTEDMLTPQGEKKTLLVYKKAE